MPRRSAPQRSPWEDRFATPSAEDLLQALDPDAAGLVASLREEFKTDFLLHERLEWCGVPWKWSLTFRADTSATSDILAYIVPSPESPCVVYRLPHDRVGSLPLRKLSRHVKEGLATAQLVAGVCWPEWKIQSATQTRDLADLLGLIHELEPSQA